jgi:hypothetical protein
MRTWTRWARTWACGDELGPKAAAEATAGRRDGHHPRDEQDELVELDLNAQIDMGARTNKNESSVMNKNEPIEPGMHMAVSGRIAMGGGPSGEGRSRARTLR